MGSSESVALTVNRLTLVKLSTIVDPAFSTCPLTGAPGLIRRTRMGSELREAYGSHFGITIPPALATGYFDSTFSELESPRSGLRWFSPAVVGGSDFYEFLSRSLPWYYSGDTWDKKHALEVLRRLHCHSMFEAGCGAGELLRAAAAAGFAVAGSELNTHQLAIARESRLAVFGPDEIPPTLRADALVMLQVLEHVPQPLEFTLKLVRQVRPHYLLVAVPGFETLLGLTTDPLVWPPHHISFWSAQAFATLAKLIEADLIEVAYQPLTWSRLAAAAAGEPHGRIGSLPPWRTRRLLRLAYELGRCTRRPWALRAHTIFGVFKFPA